MDSNLTLNPQKCVFLKEIEFWGTIFNEHGVKPNPAKVEAFKDLEPPRNKSDLVSFLCRMQSNADFIPSFSQKAAKFKWTTTHQQSFTYLIDSFKKNVLLNYFDTTKEVYIFTDAHVSGYGAMLAQGPSMESSKPIDLASKSTNQAEKHYSQIDLEAMCIDFALRKFRNYLLGSPHTVQVATDHKPLVSIFNGKRTGSIRTERIKLRHQDIQFNVVYQQGKLK